MQNFKVDFLSLTTDQAVKSDCGDITFYNQGGSDATINNTLLLRPGTSLSLSANAGELDNTIYNFRFTSVVGLINNIIVIRKIYV